MGWKLVKIASTTLALLLFWSVQALGQAPTGGYATVQLEGRPLFELLGARGLNATDRADRVNRRLESLADRRVPLPLFSETDLNDSGHETVIRLAGEPVLSVTQADAQDALTTRKELAATWGEKMRQAVQEAQESRGNPMKGAGILVRNSFADLLRSTLEWLPRLVGGCLLFGVFWLLARLSRAVIQRLLGSARFDANTRHLVQALAYYGTWGIGIIAVLSTLGLAGGSIATTLGVSGFVLGFAFKDILSHFFAGLMLLLGRQFSIGDQIVVKDFEGTVERIELRALYLRTYDNRLIIIPNGDVLTSAVISNTASPHRRCEFVVGVSYDTELESARSATLAAVRQVAGVLDAPTPDVLIDELGASSINLKVRFYASSQRAEYLRVTSECRREVKLAFDREGISIPTEIYTIVLKKSEITGDGFVDKEK